jgi:hypothetical protein
MIKYIFTLHLVIFLRGNDRNEVELMSPTKEDK